MKKMLISLIVAISLVSCTTKTIFTYSSSLTDVESPIEGQFSSGKFNNLYEDSLICVSWDMMHDGFSFVLENRITQPIVVDWNGVAYINERGISSNVIHQGVRYISRNEGQLATIIPPKSKIADVIKPSDKVKYRGTYGRESSRAAYASELDQNEWYADGWMVFHLFPAYTKKIDVRNRWLDFYLGSEVSIYLPILINGDLYDYKFIFKIDEIALRQKRPKGELIITEKSQIPQKKL